MIEYEEDWLCWTLCRFHGGVYKRAGWFAVSGSVVALGMVIARERHDEFDTWMGADSLNNSVIWSALTAVLITMVAFRTRMGYARFWEGTGLLHQMKGEWFDTISNCITFSIKSRKTKPIEVNRFRHTLVRLMSLCHASALEEISEMEEGLDTIDPKGLDSHTLEFLRDCVEVHGFNKVEVLLHLIQSVITNAHEEDVLKVPPPILSRVYQTASRGYVNLLNTKKITDTKFPFPYVQLINCLLLVHVLLTPLCLSSIVVHKVLSPILTFVTLFGMFSLNLVAIELENPFGEDDNDLPLHHFQEEMNSCLLMLLHDETDIIATTSASCNMSFDFLYRTTQGGSVSSVEELRSSRHSGRSGRRTSRKFAETCGINNSPPASNRNSLVSTEAPPSGGEGEANALGESSDQQGMQVHTQVLAATMLVPVVSDPVRVPEPVKPSAAGAPAPVSAACVPAAAAAKFELLQAPGLAPEFTRGIAAFHESLRKWSTVMEDEAKELMQKAEVLDRMGLAAVRKLEQLASREGDVPYAVGGGFKGMVAPFDGRRPAPSGDGGHDSLDADGFSVGTGQLCCSAVPKFDI